MLPMMVMTISAAISPYSIAVAPRAFCRKPEHEKKCMRMRIPSVSG
jgi:hypothetical protein